MRPRVFPAEDSEIQRQEECGGVASMRPRVFPAEDIRARLTARHPDLLQ